MPRPRSAMRKIREVLRLEPGRGPEPAPGRRGDGPALHHRGRPPGPRPRGRAGLAAAGRHGRRRRWRRRPVRPGPPARRHRRRGPCRTGRRSTAELRRKGVTLQLLWLEYKEGHPDGYQYSQFCDLYRRWQRPRSTSSMRQEHRAGEKLFVDFPGQSRPRRRPATGERPEAELFVAVLGRQQLHLRRGHPARRRCRTGSPAHVHAFEPTSAAAPRSLVPRQPRERA